MNHPLLHQFYFIEQNQKRVDDYIQTIPNSSEQKQVRDMVYEWKQKTLNPALTPLTPREEIDLLSSNRKIRLLWARAGAAGLRGILADLQTKNAFGRQNAVRNFGGLPRDFQLLWRFPEYQRVSGVPITDELDLARLEVASLKEFFPDFGKKKDWWSLGMPQERDKFVAWFEDKKTGKAIPVSRRTGRILERIGRGSIGDRGEQVTFLSEYRILMK